MKSLLISYSVLISALVVLLTSAAPVSESQNKQLKEESKTQIHSSSDKQSNQKETGLRDKPAQNVAISHKEQGDEFEKPKKSLSKEITNDDEFLINEKESHQQPAEVENEFLPGDQELPKGIDLTPAAMAEYLFLTGDFKGLEQAMADLVSVGVLTSNEAQRYKQAVGFEYEILIRQELEADALAGQNNYDSSYPFAFEYPDYAKNGGKDATVEVDQQALDKLLESILNSINTDKQGEIELSGAKSSSDTAVKNDQTSLEDQLSALSKPQQYKLNKEKEMAAVEDKKSKV